MTLTNLDSKISNNDTQNIHTLQGFMDYIEAYSPNQPYFTQAVYEVAESIIPFINQNPHYKEHKILERLTVPDRIVIFRVCWEDDRGRPQINRGFRVQFSNAIGPYKGGLRFHPSVNLDTLKFLGFEQVFKNALTTLPMGAGKGGSDFDPKGKSDNEVMRFCHAFMTELSRHIGENLDIPAGDIGVGAREISYLFGQYKRIQNKFVGAITGKGLEYGGSLIRKEATGYGCVYFTQEMLRTQGKSLDGMTCVVSGSGNVSQFTTEKVIHLGGKVVTLSDSAGFIHDPEGITLEKLEWVKELKNVKRGRIKAYADHFNCTFYEGQRPWGIPCDVAFPSATQNEIQKEDAELLLKNGCIAIGEGANMPSTPEAIHLFQEAKICYGLGKAANAGGVAVSGLEMAQNSMRFNWDEDELDQKLQNIMKRIHESCVQYGSEKDYINYVKGANIAGFKKVADAMLGFGYM